jgi:cysteine desulfurase
MIFLDYASNYPVKDEVLDSFIEAEKKYYGNANSLHPLGRETFEFLKEVDRDIHSLLGIGDDFEIIYTSSASESSNTVIKGLYDLHKGFRESFLSSEFEHTSVNSTLAYLKDQGADVSMVKTTSKGKMDLDNLRQKMENKPLLTCLTLVESEAGTIQDYHDVASIIHQNEESYLLLDATQAIGKIPFNFSDMDFVSFAPHKFGGIIGTGVLIRRKNIPVTPLIHGGKSLSMYRSSTPSVGLIASIRTALRIALENQEKNYDRVRLLCDRLVGGLKENPNIEINSFLENPYIVNLSYRNQRAMDVVSYLSTKGICVSQKSACSILNTPSKVINCIYHDKKRALSSFRVSLSELVREEEIDEFVKVLGEYENAR